MSAGVVLAAAAVVWLVVAVSAAVRAGVVLRARQVEEFSVSGERGRPDGRA